MMHTITLDPHNGNTITIPDNSVVVLVGKNGAGKSKILQSLKAADTNVILLRGNYENLQAITTINLANATTDQLRESSPVQATSMVAWDSELLTIIQFYFRTLFSIDLTISETQNKFLANGIAIDQEADGIKSLFNICYYLVSPHKTILLDEPERFLHPSLSTLFLHMLSEIAKNYQKKIIITSHRPDMMRFDLTNVILYRVSSPPSQIFDVNHWINNIAPTGTYTQRKIQPFKDWFYFHADLVFSKYVILVEGLSDVITLVALKQKLSFEYRLEDISIKCVSSSHHESGGKKRLHQMQTFLHGLIPSYTIADEDLIATDIDKWFRPAASDSHAKIKSDALAHDLLILNGELEDSYFLDTGYDYCTTAANAKGNKISAAYEQARIILSKPFSEVDAKYSYIVEFLKRIVNHAPAASDPLEPIGKNYLIDKYVKKNASSTRHLTITDDRTNINIKFNFAMGQPYAFPKSSIPNLEQAGETISNGLKKS